MCRNNPTHITTVHIGSDVPESSKPCYQLKPCAGISQNMLKPSKFF